MGMLCSILVGRVLPESVDVFNLFLRGLRGNLSLGVPNDILVSATKPSRTFWVRTERRIQERCGSRP